MEGSLLGNWVGMLGILDGCVDGIPVGFKKDAIETLPSDDTPACHMMYITIGQ